MKAIRVNEHGGPEVMRLESIPDLSAGPGQLLIEVRAAGVNPVDTYIRAGWYPIRKSLPYTPGLDAAGTILQLGHGIEQFKPADRVFVCGSLTGTYAEQTLCRPQQVHRLPDGTDFAQGAALGVPYGTACRALFGRARAVAGQTVLVHGASGGVGIAAVQLAAAEGLTVIATAGSEQGRTLAAEHGARHTLDHNDPAHFDAVRQLTDDRGADIVLEVLADVNLDRDLDIVAPGGCVVVIGSRGRIEIDPRKTMARDIAILGMSLMNAPEHERAEIYDRIRRGLQNKSLNPVIARKLPLEDAPRAHRDIIDAPHAGKLVLIP